MGSLMVKTLRLCHGQSCGKDIAICQGQACGEDIVIWMIRSVCMFGKSKT